MSNHPIVHIEIPAKDPMAAGKFYKDLFDWEFEDVPGADYVMFTSQEKMGGGFPKLDPQMYQPGEVVIYIDTPDINAKLDEIVAAGGKILLPKTEIKGMGWFAFFADPTGNRIALYTSMNPGAAPS